MTLPEHSSPSTAIVLGAAGFIGRHVARRLSGEGWRVVGVGHGGWTSQEAKEWGIDRWFAGSIVMQQLQLAAGDAAPELVVNCAGGSSVGTSYADPLADFERTVSCTATALEFVRQHGAKHARFVLASSAAVYGDQGDVDLSEAATRSPISPYGFNKVACENLCDAYSRFFGVQSSIVRLFSVYGEGLRKQLLWDAARKFSAGEHSFFGTGHELRDWIHVDDAAALLCLAGTADQAPLEVYNAGHQHASTRHVLTLLADSSQAIGAPVFTGETHAGNPRRLTANASHARRHLRWTPRIGLDEGIKRYAQWFRDLAAT